MASVQGDDDELWRAEVRGVYHSRKTVRGYFFVKHHHWNENQLWKKVSMTHAMDIIHFMLSPLARDHKYLKME